MMGDWDADLIKRCRRLNTASLIELEQPITFGIGTASHVEARVGDTTFWVSRSGDIIRVKGKPCFYMRGIGDYINVVRGQTR